MSLPYKAAKHTSRRLAPSKRKVQILYSALGQPEKVDQFAADLAFP